MSYEERIEAKIEMFLDYLASRRGRSRNSATTQEIAKRFKCKESEVENVMQIAHSRGKVWIYPHELQSYYVRRSAI